MKNPILWNITECRPLKVNRRFGRTYCLVVLVTPFMLISCLADCSSLKMETTRPKHRLTYKTTPFHMPEDVNVYFNIIPHTGFETSLLYTGL
jgi:hypothetical protein